MRRLKRGEVVSSVQLNTGRTVRKDPLQGIAAILQTLINMKFILLFLLFTTGCQAEPSQAVELGTVKWSRDLDATLAASKKSGKPVLLLFQEVPG